IPMVLRVEVDALRKVKGDPTKLKGRYSIPAGRVAEVRLRKELYAAGVQLARMIAQLEDAHEALVASTRLPGKDEPRWRANRDLVRAWVLARRAALEAQATAV